MDVAPAHSRIESNRLRAAAFVSAGAAALFALNFIPPFDNAMELVVLIGPLLTGIVMAIGRWPWKLGAAGWGLMGLISLFWDWILYDEDKAFHVALTVGVVAVVALGAAIGRGLRSARSRLAAS